MDCNVVSGDHIPDLHNCLSRLKLDVDGGGIGAGSHGFQPTDTSTWSVSIC